MISLLLALALTSAPAEEKKILVILWFDTEDYILVADDDACLHLANFLSKEGIRATFKVVGEKARVLEQRGRTDVIEALKKHEIGFHSNFHSTQPTPAMYMSPLGWDEGVAEFDRREGPGHRDVKRIFGQDPSCYGQPGSSWGPQSFGAMKKWGMPVYLDAGSHVGIDRKPIYYGSILTLFHLAHTPRVALTADGLEEGKKRIDDARKKLLAEGGGIISVYYHPCEWVHKQFWDGVNFSNGANPPREKWVPPPQKTPEETRIAYETFEAWIRYIKAFDDVQFITARDAARIYRDKARGRSFTPKEIGEIAGVAADEEVTFLSRGEYNLAPSEVFALLNGFVVNGPTSSVALKDTPNGPATPVPALAAPVTTDWSQFSRTAADVQAYLQHHGRVPTTVWLGSVGVPPEAYLRALAKVARKLIEGGPPETVEVPTAKFAAEKYVSKDGPNLWGWVIFPRGFLAPDMMALGKRQAWTIKPAVRHWGE
jgi:hypothetical protein